MTDVLRYVFLELGRFNKCIWEVRTIFDKWMYPQGTGLPVEEIVKL